MVAADAEQRAQALQDRGVRATASGRPAVAVRHLRRGLRLIGWTPEGSAVPDQYRRLAARLLISLGYAESELGHTRRGFALLDDAGALVAAQDRGILVQQRALMRLRTGDTSGALVDFGEAVPLLDGSEHSVVLARTLLNRASLHIWSGRIPAGRADLAACRAVASAEGLRLLEGKALHNLGLADALLGDLPQALDHFTRAAECYRDEAPGFIPVVLAARARALLAAGLAGQAAESLDAGLDALRDQRLSQDEAEAQLLRARAALGVGDAAASIDWAARAARGFQRRGNEVWSALARSQVIRAEFASAVATTRRAGRLSGRAGKLAGQLRILGLRDDAHLVELVAARVEIRAGRLAQATELLSRSGSGSSFGWLETRMTERLARAELALAQERPGAALAQARAGLAELHDRRSRLGSLDLRVGTAALGRELAALGLRTALAGGRAQAVLTWSERSRAQAFRVLPVRAPDDPQTAGALAELRQLRHRLRTAELAGQREPATAARCTELERLLREREWRTAGAGSAGAALTGMRPALGDRALVSYLDQDGQLAAVVLAGGQTRLVGLGAVDGLAETVRRLRADLDALAGRELPERLAEVVRGSAQRQAEALGQRLIAPLSGLVGDRELVVVPTAVLAPVPWALLPALRGRPVSVAPSAAVWLTAQARPSTVDPRVAMVAGPALEHVDREFDEIAAMRPGGTDLRGERATVAAALTALDGAGLAHLAGHGHHEPENVLFSRLDLADGPLMAYDVQRLAAVPRLITLSACDIGRAEYRTGDEQLGFTSALLYAGTSCVVAAVSRVRDETAVGVMTALHRALAGGAGPAAALAAASEKEPLATFVAFGAG